MKKILFFLALFLVTTAVIAQESFMVKTETRYWDNSKTFAGYTMFGTRGVTYLIDFEGHVIHTWDGINDHGVQVTSGMYIYILKADNQQLAKKMIYYN